MKKTIIAIAILTFSLIGTAWGQGKRRAPRQLDGSTAMGGGSGVGMKNRKPMNLGDTATHEIGHRTSRKAKGQDVEVENDETHRTRQRAMRTETVDKNETFRKGQPTNKAKYDGIDGESNDARIKNPKPGKAQNLLPYMEQSNLRKSRPIRKPRN